MVKKIDCSLKKNKNNLKCKRLLKPLREGEFSIVIPKNDNSGRPIKTKKIQSYINQVNGIFGGSTTIPVTKGCYVENKKFVCEDGIRITANRDFNGKYSKSAFKKMNSTQRQKQLLTDYKKMQK